MNAREKRLQRLIALRQAQLDERLLKLAKVRVSEQDAERHSECERLELERAELERNNTLSRPVAVKNFVDANDYVVSCARKRELAELQLTRTRRAVSQAQGEVAVAKNDLKKIELLSERLRQQERLRAARVEQHLSDEFAARAAANHRRRGES